MCETLCTEYYDDEKHEWVVEPGDFSIMVGASSEDIRLSGKLTVEDPNAPMQAQAKPDAPVTASTNPESAMNVLDKKMNTVWEGNKGDYITFALENDSRVDGVPLHSAEATVCRRSLKSSFQVAADNS